MKMWEINQFTKEEVEQNLQDSLEEYQNLRFQHATHQLDNPMRIRIVRKDIARLRTVLSEMTLDLRNASPDKTE